MAGGVINTGSHPQALWPGIRAWFGAQYKTKSKGTYYAPIFAVVKSDKAYERSVAHSSFGLGQKKPEGSPISYDSVQQEWTRDSTHSTYALGYVVTEEELEDNLYEEVSKKRSSMLVRSMLETREINGHAILNNAFTSGTGGDGVYLCSASHPTLSGNQSNILSTAAAFSESAYEDIVTLMANAKNSRGIRYPLHPTLLIGNVALRFDFERVAKSVMQTNTANNNLNAIVNLGLIDKYHVTPYMTSTTQWFVKSDIQEDEGLILFERRKLEFKQDNDFDTSNAKAKASERYVFDWNDWRGVYGSQAA